VVQTNDYFKGINTPHLGSKSNSRGGDLRLFGWISPLKNPGGGLSFGSNETIEAAKV